MGGLNYLGGSGAGPGTMPAGIPGFGPQGGQPGPSMPGMMPPGTNDPASQQWQAVTQSDGSVLLHMKLPDGSLGPVVQVIAPPKSKGARAM